MNDHAKTVIAVWLAKEVFCAVINAIFWYKSPTAWVTFCETQPRLAAVVKIFRSIGLEPTRLLVSIRELAAGERGTRAVSIPPPGGSNG